MLAILPFITLCSRLFSSQCLSRSTSRIISGRDNWDDDDVEDDFSKQLRSLGFGVLGTFACGVV
ncbi:hypothetical protein BC938DRAFT_474974 [Jimgerdemannia flammicorona]|uniref:26S proteasome complex subunit SEM1 n=1 Tax=Jimgerdemannia flammicorona TaxID=994334 RepID=A0A433QS50_9FUNG|nr:hypothetical protein BC938DRAFT_474974 [Jimgerdemannia flammicorona]